MFWRYSSDVVSKTANLSLANESQFLLISSTSVSTLHDRLCEKYQDDEQLLTSVPGILYM